MKNYKNGGKVEENGPAILHEGETVIRAHGVPADKMSKAYHEYWTEIRPSGASNAGTEQFSGNKSAKHGHEYPGRPYPAKGTKTGHPTQDQNKVVPCLDMEVEVE
jgi:hypothetical protein